MDTFCLCNVSKLSSIVRLQDLGFIPKVQDGPFEEIHGGVPALFQVGIQKAFPGGFVKDGILIKLLRHGAAVAGFWNVFDVHLPFHTQLSGRVVRLGLIGLFCGRSTAGITEPAVNAVKGPRVTGIAFLGTQFSVQLTDRNVRVAAVIIGDPLELPLRVGVGMNGMGTMRLVHKGFTCSVKPAVPTEQGGFGDVVSSGHKSHADSGAVKFDGVKSCMNFMWQISLSMCYSIHDG